MIKIIPRFVKRHNLIFYEGINFGTLLKVLSGDIRQAPAVILLLRLLFDYRFASVVILAGRLAF
jgi:hypothetical protein